MYSQLCRCCTTRGSGTRISRVSPAKVEACETVLFIEKFPCFENIEHLVDFVYDTCSIFIVTFCLQDMAINIPKYQNRYCIKFLSLGVSFKYKFTKHSKQYNFRQVLQLICVAELCLKYMQKCLLVLGRAGGGAHFFKAFFKTLLDVLCSTGRK